MLDIGKRAPATNHPDRSDFRTSARPRLSFGLASLRSRKGLLGVGAVLFLMMGLFYVVRRAPTYTASGQLLIYIKQVLPGVDLTTLPGRADLSLVRNQIEMLRSGNVLTKVVQTLQLNQDPDFAPNSPADAVRRKLDVRQVGTSHIISVSFKASEPEKAARVVNSVISTYLQELVRAAEAASSKAPALRELYQNLGPSAHVISEADPPLKADGPPALLILIAAALFGLGIAAALSLLLDMINDTIRSARQMEATLGLECLGIIARHPVPGTDAGGTIARQRRLLEDQTMRRVAAAVLDRSAWGLRTMGVTSTLPGEGTTTLAIALAQTLTAMGRRVLLIDGVCENPAVSHWALTLPLASPRSGNGRSHVFGNLVEAQSGLHILPVAESRRGGAEATCSRRLAAILGRSTDLYEFVIVDMPSLAEGPDVRAAAESLDGFLLVVKWGETESELVRQGFQSAGEAREKCFGSVLNMADEKTMKFYESEPQAKREALTSS